MNTDVRKQLFGAELTHPEVDASRLRLSREPMFKHPQNWRRYSATCERGYNAHRFVR